jgi:hypothetical protein
MVGAEREAIDERGVGFGRRPHPCINEALSRAADRRGHCASALFAVSRRWVSRGGSTPLRRRIHVALTSREGAEAGNGEVGHLQIVASVCAASQSAVAG